jgi:GNAT superfamily N-acetyltransferase
MSAAQARIIPAGEQDVPLILEMIHALAEYERLSHEVVATEEMLRESLFGPKPAAEVVFAYDGQECVAFAVYFSTYSTFLAQSGIYLEDLYVKPEARGKGMGFALLRHLAKVAKSRNCGRLEWSVLNWNEPSIQFYKKLGAVPMDEWTKYQLAGEALGRLTEED